MKAIVTTPPADRLLPKEVIATRLGATRLPDGRWSFLLWAPNTRNASIHTVGDHEDIIPMEPLPRGYHCAVVENLAPDAPYLYRLDDDRELPDPASRFQPQGVHGPSQILDTRTFRWSDEAWKGRNLEDGIFYELHVGTFTEDGNFDGVIEQLPYLSSLGITTIELMPIAQFPGARNWGYDGVFPYAAQNSYGGPAALQRLVDAAHRYGLGVALDVVYNHLGPEGNYLNAFGPYFTDRYRTPWGDAINYDGAGCEEVRRFFIENALYWLEDFHFDALRLDAIHGIYDFGARHFLAELKSEVALLSKRLGRQIHLIAESDLNDSRTLRGQEQGGYGLDAQWSDDFHHSVHTLLTKENSGYYADFEGIAPLIETLRNGWFYSGQYSQYRQRRHGNSAQGIAASKFVVSNQNHDQIGNRASGDRLATSLDLEQAKLAAGITLLSPFVPLLFMGEEYGETAPFQYFTSHGDSQLVEAVRRGRREEFASFGWEENVPDPQAESTFLHSKLNSSQKKEGRHQKLFAFYQTLIRLRKEFNLGSLPVRSVERASELALILTFRGESNKSLAIAFNFAEDEILMPLPSNLSEKKILINSADRRWEGPQPSLEPIDTLFSSGNLQISPHSFVMLQESLSSSEIA